MPASAVLRHLRSGDSEERLDTMPPSEAGLGGRFPEMTIIYAVTAN